MNNYKSVRTAVVGVGSMGKNHARIYKEISNLVAVVDPNEKIGKEIADKYDVIWLADHKDLEGKVDAVSIAVPTKYHESVSIDMANFGINILVEKLGDHLSAVADYSGAMAKELGLDEDQINHCYLSGLMHDIGAIEYRLSKSWVNLENSARILDATLSILKYDTLLSLERDYIFAHQEFYEGKGSPLGIKGKNIPLGARILAVANELDNLTRLKGLTFKAAKNIILDNSNLKFDPRVTATIENLKPIL